MSLAEMRHVTCELNVDFTEAAAQALKPVCEPGQRLLIDDEFLRFIAPTIIERARSGRSFVQIEDKQIWLSVRRTSSKRFEVDLDL